MEAQLHLYCRKGMKVFHGDVRLGVQGSQEEGTCVNEESSRGGQSAFSSGHLKFGGTLLLPYRPLFTSMCHKLTPGP